jgi:FKBP-type peptidyl-prolyl cis-trans isomerase
MRLAWTVVVGVGLLAARASAAEEPSLKTQKERQSYAMAVGMARSLQRQGVDIDAEVFSRGLRDALTGGKLLLPEDDLHGAMSALAGALKQEQARAKAALAKKKQAGEAFLAENAKRKGVVSLPSGLQYSVLRAGDGRTPTDDDSVQCHYRGSLIDGTEFNSSLRRGSEPAVLEVAKVIPGWREALKLMPAGSTWRLFIPPGLAYGTRGGGPKSKIGPNETLIFEVELVAIGPPSAQGEGKKTPTSITAPRSRAR